MLMKSKFILLFLWVFQLGFAQEEEVKTRKYIEDPKPIYKKFELSTPLRVNQYAGEINPYTGEKNLVSGRWHQHESRNWSALRQMDWHWDEHWIRLESQPLFGSRSGIWNVSPKSENF